MLKKMISHGHWVLLEVMAVFAFLVFLACALFVIRIYSGPLSLKFAQSTIESALTDAIGEEGAVKFEKVAIFLPDLQGSLLLALKGITLTLPGQDGPISIQNIQVGLSRSALLKGRFKPESVLLQEPALQITRYEDGSFGFGLHDQEEALQLPTAQFTDQNQQPLAIVDSIFDVLDQDDKEGTNLNRLQRVSIQDAKLLLSDQSRQQTLYISDFDFNIVDKAEGISIEMATQDFANSDVSIHADAFLSRQMRESLIHLDVQKLDLKILEGFVPQDYNLEPHSLVLDGQAKILLDDTLKPKSMEFEISSLDGHVFHEDIPIQTLALKDLKVKGSCEREQNMFDIESLQVVVDDIPLQVSGSFRISDDVYDGQMTLDVSELEQSKIKTLWPKSLDEEAVKRWLVDKSSGGIFKDIKAILDFKISRNDEGSWVFDVPQVTADLAYENLEVNYRDPLPKVENAKGTMRFILDQELLQINVDGATIGGMQAQKAEIEFINIIQKGKGVADMHVQLTGGLPDAFRFIESEPIAVQHKFNTDEIKGQIDLGVHLNFPTDPDLNFEDIDIEINGQSSGVFLPAVMQDFDLSNGAFKVSIDSEKVSAKGTGDIAGRPSNLEWMEFLDASDKPYETKIKANLRVDQNLCQDAGIDLSDFMTDSFDIDVVYTGYKNGTSEADIVVDLTPATLLFEPFGYRKPVGQKGNSKFKAVFNERDELSEIKAINMFAPNLEIKDGTFSFGRQSGETYLSKGKIPTFNAGLTQSSVEFERSFEGATKAVIQASYFDLRPILSDDTPDDDDEQKAPLTLSLQSTTLRTSDDEILSNAKLYAELGTFGQFEQLEFDARAGEGDLYLRYKPDEEGKRTFRLEADDAGATLRAFEVYDNIIGGQLIVYGEPARSDKDYNLVGLAEITDFKIVKAPALARVLGAMSMPGIGQLLGNEGVVFSKLESKFDWLYRPQGGLVVLKDGRTSGNALGLTFDGLFDNATGAVDISGTIIPVSGLNKALGKVPVLGDLLGGRGGVFAATYTVKGDDINNEDEDLDVVVNPLSVLAPGILRRILFQSN